MPRCDFACRGCYLNAEANRHFAEVKAVDGIDITLRAGQTVGVVGESGAGKSLTYQIPALLRPGVGVVGAGQAVEDRDLAVAPRHRAEHRGRVGTQCHRDRERLTGLGQRELPERQLLGLFIEVVGQTELLVGRKGGASGAGNPGKFVGHGRV